MSGQKEYANTGMRALLEPVIICIGSDSLWRAMGGEGGTRGEKYEGGSVFSGSLNMAGYRWDDGAS